MDSVPALTAPSRSIEGGRSPASGSSRLLNLASCMLVLGTIRALCLTADFVLTLRESSRSNPRFASIAGDNAFFYLAAGVWPLLIGIALWRSGWNSLLRAAALTFLSLGLVGALEAGLAWTHVQAASITIGSFHLGGSAFVKPSGADLLLGLLGTGQILAELAVGVCALRFGLDARSRAAANRDHDHARQARLGRLALYVALAFAILMIRIPVWSAYIDVVARSTWFREYILANGARSGYRAGGLPPGPREAEERRELMDLGDLMDAAMKALREDRYSAAKHDYAEAAKLADSIPQESARTTFRRTIGVCYNNLAWLLATCPDESIRDPAEAVRRAKRAVELAPKEGIYWNTLGVAYYRAGEWDDAKDALYRSMELRNDGDAFDWFFLGLVHLKLGDRTRARDWYDRAVDWYRKYRPENEDELYRFQVEAGAMLGLPKPAALPPRPKEDAESNGNDVLFPLQRGIRGRSMVFPHARARSRAPDQGAEDSSPPPSPEPQIPSPDQP